MRILTLALVAVMAFSCDLVAQKLPGLDGSPADIAVYRPDGRGTAVAAKVIYSRPQKKGRTMLGDKIGYGKVWRTGANEATEIKLYKDMSFGGTMVKAGTYSLFTIPGESEWSIIFNSALDDWGAYAYDEAKNVATITASASNDNDEVEAFTIAFSDGAMVLAWENTMVSVPVE